MFWSLGWSLIWSPSHVTLVLCVTVSELAGVPRYEPHHAASLQQHQAMAGTGRHLQHLPAPQRLDELGRVLARRWRRQLRRRRRRRRAGLDSGGGGGGGSGGGSGGGGGGRVSPCSSWPTSPDPNDITPPPSSSTRLWKAPADTCSTFLPRSAPMSLGVCNRSVSPFPGFPCAPFPNDITPPPSSTRRTGRHLQVPVPNPLT